MPMTHADGTEIPTPEETVVALLEQGYKPADIIRDAEAAIETARDGLAWVDAIAAEHSAATTDKLAAHTLAEQVIEQARKGGASADVIKEAEAAHGAAALDVTIASMSSTDANIAAFQHRQHAQETIEFAERRIAAVKKK